MLSRWKAVVLKHRKPQTSPAVAACTPSTSDHRTQRVTHHSSTHERDDDDVDSITSAWSDESLDPPQGDRTRGPTDWCQQTLMQRVVGHKNRLVQRVLVACKFADASKDMYFRKKQCEYDQAIQLLIDTKEIIELYAQSLHELSIAVRNVAGNASDIRSHDPEESTTFLVAAEAIEDRGYEYLDQVRDQVLKLIDDRVVDLRHVSELLRERANLQLDVDYAKRMLVLATKRGELNVMADKKKALQIAKLRRRAATQQITQLLRHYDHKQEQEMDDIITQFGFITKAFFHYGAALLRAVEPPQSHQRSSSIFSTTRRLTQSVGERDPIAI